MRLLAHAALAIALTGCVSPPERVQAREKFTADQVYARRREFSKKIVRADFVWNYGFEKCTAYVPAEGGGLRFLRIEFDAKKVRAASPREWEVVQRVFRDFSTSMQAALKHREKESHLAEFTMHVDADVEVVLSAYEFRKDVIVIGDDLTLKVVAIHSIREEEG